MRNLFNAAVFMAVGFTVAVGVAAFVFASVSMDLTLCEMYDEAYIRLTGCCGY